VFTAWDWFRALLLVLAGPPAGLTIGLLTLWAAVEWSSPW
jgi:hypothetical protein